MPYVSCVNIFPITFAVLATLWAAGGAVDGVGLTEGALELAPFLMVIEEIFFVRIGPLVVIVLSLFVLALESFVDIGLIEERFIEEGPLIEEFLPDEELIERLDRDRGPLVLIELECGTPVLLRLVARLLKCDELDLLEPVLPNEDMGCSRPERCGCFLQQ